MAKDYPKGIRGCFNCNQTDHMRSQCPQLASRMVQALAPMIVCITNGWRGKAEVSMARGRAFQLTAEEVRATLEVMAGMSFFITMFI